MNDPVYDKLRPEVTARLKAKTDRNNQAKAASPKPKAVPKPHAVKEETNIVIKATGARSRKAEEKAKAKEEAARGRANAEAFARERAEKLERSIIVSNKPSRPTLSFQSQVTSRSSTPSVVSSGGTDPIVHSSTHSNHASFPAAVVHSRFAFKAKRGSMQNGDSSALSTDASRHSRGWSFSSVPVTAHPDSQSSVWSPATGISEPLVKSPETTPSYLQSWPPPGYPKVNWDRSNFQDFSDSLARFFGE